MRFLSSIGWYNFFSEGDVNERGMKTRQRDSTLDVLNDLIKINAERAEGYTLAIQVSKDADLKIMFRNLAEESKKNISDLSRTIFTLGGDPTLVENTAGGKIYHVWFELKTSLSGKDRQSILNSCEFGEDAAFKAYTSAIREPDLTTEAFDLIYRQAQLQRASHDVIKAYRDANINVRQTRYERSTK